MFLHRVSVMALLKAGGLLPVRRQFAFSPCTPLLVCNFLDGPGCPKVVCQLETDAANCTESLGIVLENKTEKTLWIVLANFQFRSASPLPPYEPIYKTKCGQFSTDSPLPPKQGRQLAFRFGVGHCPSKEQKEAKQRYLAVQRGEEVPPQRQAGQLLQDEVVEYSFEIQSWVEFPWPDLLLSPDERQAIRGKLTVPAGTQDDYCIHHFVHSHTTG